VSALPHASRSLPEEFAGTRSLYLRSVHFALAGVSHDQQKDTEGESSVEGMVVTGAFSRTPYVPRCLP